MQTVENVENVVHKIQ